MNKLSRYISIIVAVFGFCWTMQLSAQDVWPGDVNNNGLVNSVDLLYVGIAYGATGPERDEGDDEWEAQAITSLWSQVFPGGLNYAYADCDGDGVVDEEDIDDVIIENFGLIHGVLMPDGFNNGEPGNAPVLELIPSATQVNEGATVSFDIVLGSESMPVQDFYGLAFTMTFDSDLTQEEDEITVSLANNSWIDPTNGSLSRSLTVFEENGHAEIGITRINQQLVETGFGTIASFSIVIEDDIASLEIDTFHLTIDSVMVTSSNLETTSIHPIGAIVLITPDTILSSTNESVNSEIALYPNPADQIISFVSPLPFKAITVYNVFGQAILREQYLYSWPSQKLILTLPDVPNGMYILHLELQEGILTKPFFIQHSE